MAGSTPFSQLAGIPLLIYVAPVGEAVTDVDNTPAGNWVLLGNTDGEQSLKHEGALAYWRDNTQQGPRKATRPEEDVIYNFTLVDITLENYAIVLDQASDVVTAAGPPAIKTMPLTRGATPNEYAYLLKASTLSGYAALPAQFVIPRGVMDGEPELAFAKDGRPGLETEVHAIADTTQSAGDELGWMVMQTA